MKHQTSKMFKAIAATGLAAGLAFLTACGGGSNTESGTATSQEASQESQSESTAKVVNVGICNYVDDASLNQIYENIESELNNLSKSGDVEFKIAYDNCQADPNLLNQIISNFISDKVDIMVGIATPVAMSMQAATEDNEIPVIFSAVSDPLTVGLVDSMDAPGGNITGTSDFLNTEAIMDLIFAENPDTDYVGLLYDMGQDSSTQAIADAKSYLDAKGIAYVEKTGTTVDEVMLAADSLISEGVDAVFTPSDNTVMTAELSIYEAFANAGVKHYAGADSFALNGAFVGYGVDYANLGVETARMVYDVMVNGADPASTPVKTFDNGIATINVDICQEMGLDVAEVSASFEGYCTSIKEIHTAEEF